MRITERIVSYGHGSLSPKYLAVHETANPGATAGNHVKYWMGNDTYAVHYVADWTGLVFHTVPDDRLCWHVGGGNAYCVGIELCHAENVEDFIEVWNTGVEFCAYYLAMKGWGIDRLISHNDARLRWGGTDHTDPAGADGKSGYFGKFGRTWDQFRAEVAARLEGDMPSAKEVADAVWAKAINGHTAGERLYLCNVKDYESDDKSGRGKDADDHTRLCWMAAKQEQMQESIDALSAKLDQIARKL